MMAELRAYHARVLEKLRLALNVFTTRDITLARRLVAEKTAMREAEAKTADSHYARLREGRMESIATSSIHTDVIRDLKRINVHLASESAAGGPKHPCSADGVLTPYSTTKTSISTLAWRNCFSGA
jgi:Na+/phosphate symporter